MSEIKFAIEKNEDGNEHNGTVKVSGIAYSGDEIIQFGSRVVVNVKGMEFAPQIPLMNTHDNSTSAKLGEVTASISNGEVVFTGTITASGEEAEKIIEDGKKSKWQTSIGAKVSEWLVVREDQKVKVNGREFAGPIYVAAKSILREISVVAIGADKNAIMTIEASFDPSQAANITNNNVEGVEIMADENKQSKTENGEINAAVQKTAEDLTNVNDIAAKASESAVLAERKRVSEIKKAFNGDFPEIEAQAVEEGWDINMVNAKLVEKIREKRPAVGVNVNCGNHEIGKNEIEAALCMNVGIDGDSLVKSYGEKTVEAAEKMRGITLAAIVKESIRLSGGVPSRYGIDNDDIRASFSTVSLPGILSNVANKKLLQSFNAQPVIAQRLATAGDLVNFRQSERFRLTDMGNLEPVAPDGEIKDGGLSEDAAKNQLDTYGKKFCLTRQMIINDDLGAFMKVPTAMGNRAARLIDQLFFSRLLANPTQDDGNALFSAAHRNLLTGDTSALSKESLEKAVALFLDQVDSDNQPISVEPRFLLVPSALKHLAIELTKGTNIIVAGSASVLRPEMNALTEDNLDVVSSPYLNNASYAGHSATGWYLFGNPNQVDTFEIGYLKGKRTPTVESGETDFNTLGMWFRVYFDLGVREQDYRGMVKSNGAA